MIMETVTRKKALLVGINDYQGINDLRGCLNDVTNIRNILKTFFAYDNEDIRVLTDSRATRDNILFRLHKMIEGAKPGDSLLFHFSGHGSQIRDRQEDELKDHMDELICPYDMDWDGTFITDDMLGAVLDTLSPGVTMEVILDCCHSGTGTRNDDMGRPEEMGPLYPRINRFMTPPLDITCRYEGDDQLVAARKSFSRDQRITMNHVLWAGCRDNQRAADAYINGAYNGAFTYYFCKHIRESQGIISRLDLHKRVSDSLKHNNYYQTPQLECSESWKPAHMLASPGLEEKV